MEIIEIIARYVWPAVLAWNIYLFTGLRSQELAHIEYKLFVAENYTSKDDLKTMFDAFERRFDDKFRMLAKLVDK